MAKALKDQRKMFSYAYASIPNEESDKKLGFVKTIKNMLEFMEYLESEKSASNNIFDLDKERSLYIRFIYKEHQIVIPLLSHIYSNDNENFSK